MNNELLSVQYPIHLLFFKVGPKFGSHCMELYTNDSVKHLNLFTLKSITRL